MPRSASGSTKERLLSGTVLPVMLGLGLTVGGYVVSPALAGRPTTVTEMRGVVASDFWRDH